MVTAQESSTETDQSSPSTQSTQEDISAIDETELLIGDEEQAGGGGEDGQRRLTSFTAWDFIRMLLILGAVVGVIYAIFFFMKRSSYPKSGGNELFRVLSTQMLSNNRSIHLVEVGRQIFLLGAGEGSVTLLSEITDKETLDEIRIKLSEGKIGENKGFKQVFGGLFSSQPAGRVYPAQMDQTTQYIKKQRERLKNL
jgi:flagellar protein FliO/FliZ